MFAGTTTADRVIRVVLIVVCILALALIVWGGIYMMKGRYDRGVVEKATAKENKRIEAATTIANETMAEEKAVDVKQVETQREELKRATVETNDGLTARQRRGCIILRQQGQDLAGIPTCRVLAR